MQPPMLTGRQADKKTAERHSLPFGCVCHTPAFRAIQVGQVDMAPRHGVALGRLDGPAAAAGEAGREWGREASGLDGQGR